ncbi:hypothetical protein VB779_03410 [Haloarculaceae archaeon H-GB11]|nr:hypothetical protein [Haloarculaceae archaeon H-GB11]
MYLGIHWLTDVVAGVALAVLSVAVAMRVTNDADRARSRTEDSIGGHDRWRRND